MNYMGILFLTDFWTEKQIPHPREGKKIPPPRASPSGEEFFNLPLGEEFVSRSKNPSGIGYSHQGMYFSNSFIPGYVFYVVKGTVFLYEFAT